MRVIETREWFINLNYLDITTYQMHERRWPRWVRECNCRVEEGCFFTFTDALQCATKLVKELNIRANSNLRDNIGRKLDKYIETPEINGETAFFWRYNEEGYGDIGVGISVRFCDFDDDE